MKNLRFNSEADYEAYLQERPALRAANPEIFKPIKQKESEIIRQSRKEPNKTEIRFYNERLLPWLHLQEIDEVGEHESIRLKLANGCLYVTDWPTWKGDSLTIWEVKGEKIWDDAIVKLKVAASRYKRITFFICKYTAKDWLIQKILP